MSPPAPPPYVPPRSDRVVIRESGTETKKYRDCLILFPESLVIARLNHSRNWSFIDLCGPEGGASLRMAPGATILVEARWDQIARCRLESLPGSKGSILFIEEDRSLHAFPLRPLSLRSVRLSLHEHLGTRFLDATPPEAPKTRVRRAAS